MILDNLEAELFVTIDSSGRAGRGVVVSADLVARIKRNGVFIGNWVVMRFFGPDAEQAAEDMKDNLED